jgi:hypothetical protein
MTAEIGGLPLGGIIGTAGRMSIRTLIGIDTLIINTTMAVMGASIITGTVMAFITVVADFVV